MQTAQRQSMVTRKGQVTIPVEMRRAIGVADGGPVMFTLVDGVLTVRSAQKLSLADLLSGFDAVRHRHTAEERVWDDAPQGRESL
ncbi:MAG: AbrB/MazE/SpoVT family DNA-binding domain-containing protein [Alphaproteobacteria bacterium]|nr:AbrB/MazE/SpoVT family DNA-binding domain-containing protein [Alphaproteobacteria bacterium]